MIETSNRRHVRAHQRGKELKDMTKKTKAGGCAPQRPDTKEPTNWTVAECYGLDMWCGCTPSVFDWVRGEVWKLEELALVTQAAMCSPLWEYATDCVNVIYDVTTDSHFFMFVMNRGGYSILVGRTLPFSETSLPDTVMDLFVVSDAAGDRLTADEWRMRWLRAE